MSSDPGSVNVLLPKVVVFDLDGCVWEPEMYELAGGAPFKVKKNGNLKVKSGQFFSLLLFTVHTLARGRPCALHCPVATYQFHANNNQCRQ